MLFEKGSAQLSHMFFATIRRTTTFGAAKSRCLSRWSVIECAPVNRYASARSTRADRHCVLTSVQGGASSGVSPHSCVHLRYTVTLIRRNLLTSPSGSWHRSVTESVALPPAMRECLCLTLNSPTNFLPGKSSARAARFATPIWRLCELHPEGPDSSTEPFGARNVG
jgi:hypothetical protein